MAAVFAHACCTEQQRAFRFRKLSGTRSLFTWGWVLWLACIMWIIHTVQKPWKAFPIGFCSWRSSLWFLETKFSPNTRGKARKVTTAWSSRFLVCRAVGMAHVPRSHKALVYAAKLGPQLPTPVTRGETVFKKFVESLSRSVGFQNLNIQKLQQIKEDPLQSVETSTVISWETLPRADPMCYPSGQTAFWTARHEPIIFTHTTRLDFNNVQWPAPIVINYTDCGFSFSNHLQLKCDHWEK